MKTRDQQIVLSKGYQRMQIESYSSGIYRVLKINNQLVVSHLHELKVLIQGYVQQDEKYIAIHFSDVSYLYSGAIAVLVSCYKIIKDASGYLCLLEPNTEVVDLLKMMGIDVLIPVYGSDENLPNDIRQIEMMTTADFRN